MNQIKDFIEYVFNVFKIWVIIQPWETGLIVRAGKKVRKVSGGVYFKIPYIDSVYVQEERLRVVPLPIQTLTTKDSKTITLNGSVGYCITDIETLYNTLYHPEITIMNMVMNTISEEIYSLDAEQITQKKIEESVLKELEAKNYGLTFDYFKLTNFAIVKTFRLIQDQSWTDETLNMNQKK